MTTTTRQVGRPFQPGKSGNPGGRPKRTPLTDELRRVLNEKDGDKRTNAYLVALEIVNKAKAGDMAAARLLFEYIEGKPLQSVEIAIQETAQRLAAERGLDPAELIRRAEAIANGRG